MILRTLILSLSAMLSGIACLLTAAPANVSSGRPLLIVYHSASCGPCRDFDRAWQTDPVFRDAIRRAFDIRGLRAEIPAQRATAEQLGADRMPAFIRQSAERRWCPPIFGFSSTEDGKQTLLRELGIYSSTPGPIPVPAEGLPREKPVTVPDPAGRAELDQLSRRQRQIGEDLMEVHSALGQAITQGRSTAGRVTELQRHLDGLSQQVSRSTETLAQELASTTQQTRTETRSVMETISERIERQLQERLNNISTEISTARPAGRDPPTGASGERSVGGTLLNLGLTGAAAYFGLPVAGAGVVAGVVSWLVTRRRGRRADAAASGSFPAATEDNVRQRGGPLPREYREAVELLQLAEREGRLPIHEALRGTLADDEIDRLCESPDSATRQLGIELRDRIARRFNTVAPISQDPESF